MIKSGQTQHLVVAAAAVGYDLHARQRERDVRRGRREQLLARLGRQDRVVERQRRVAQGTTALPCDAPDLRGQAVLLHLARPLPALEVARLPACQQTVRDATGFPQPLEVKGLMQQISTPVVAVICHGQLGPDEEDLAIEEEDAAVVAHPCSTAGVSCQEWQAPHGLQACRLQSITDLCG